MYHSDFWIFGVLLFPAAVAGAVRVIVMVSDRMVMQARRREHRRGPLDRSPPRFGGPTYHN